MPTLLVIDRDDCFLPRGWVSAILPGQMEPSEYERSGGLWKAVSLPDDRISPLPAEAASVSLSLAGMKYEDGKLLQIESRRECMVSHLAAGAGSLRPVNGPDALDRSHSTVWDYGPGRTYSTPQAAQDALIAQEGSDPFSEVHYIRGFSGTYTQGPSGAVLAITTVSPSARFPLVVDVESGEQVVFDGQAGSACLGGSEVSHVRVFGLKFVQALFGVVLADIGGQAASDWWVKNCAADGSGASMHVGVLVFKAVDLRIVFCDLHNLLYHGAGSYPGLPADSPVRVAVSGCRITSSSHGIWNNAEACYLLFNNTLQAASSGLKHEGESPLILAGMVNNVFHAGGAGFDCIRTQDLAAGDLRVLHSNGNCFHPGANGSVAELNGLSLDLDGWREYFGQDENSICADPLLDNDLVPSRQSPCRGAGVVFCRTGMSGKTRTASVDMGFEQVTEAFVPGAMVRRSPEIVRRT